jgi:hypothetical protein
MNIVLKGVYMTDREQLRNKFNQSIRDLIGCSAFDSLPSEIMPHSSLTVTREFLPAEQTPGVRTDCNRVKEKKFTYIPYEDALPETLTISITDSSVNGKHDKFEYKFKTSPEFKNELIETLNEMFDEQGSNIDYVQSANDNTQRG